MSDFLTIRGLIERVLSGTIRIPRFQRGFVWEPDNVAFLMDSIYRGYPIGSVLFWRSNEQLATERDLGPFKLPDPMKKWPIDYVLDGQQRLTSLFGVFQTILTPSAEIEHFEIYYDLEAQEGALENQFVAVDINSKIPETIFPLRLLFDPAQFAQRTRNLSDTTLKRVVDLQRRFQESQIKNEVIEFEDREQIAMIFERVNRAGVPLDTFQLLTAWTWSDEFDLNEKIESLASDVVPYGYSRLGEQQDLLMKCAGAVIAGDASIKSIVGLHGPTVRNRFDVIQRGIFGAIEFLQQELNIQSLEILPYPAMLVPLAKFFATDAVSGFHPSSKQRKALVRWFWRSCFSLRYSSGVGTAHAQDIEWMGRLKDDENTEVKISTDIYPHVFIWNNFNIGSVFTKIFVLMLAARNPRSLISQAKINIKETLLRCNRNEFHHIFPKAYLTKTGERSISPVANFCFLSAADNQKIKDKRPSEYIGLIREESRDDVAKKALLPPNWHALDYRAFLLTRSDILADEACRLCGEPRPTIKLSQVPQILLPG